jgi:hypothetical protein
MHPPHLIDTLWADIFHEDETSTPSFCSAVPILVRAVAFLAAGNSKKWSVC